MSLPQSLVLIGGGEHASVIAEAVALQAERWQIDAIVDPLSSSLAEQLGVKALKTDAEAIDFLEGRHVVLGLGAVNCSGLRSRVAARYDLHKVAWATIIHPSAIVAPSAQIGPGTVILAGAVVNSNASIGAHSILNTRCVIEHDDVLGSFVSIAPGAILGGGTSVGEGTFIGLGAMVRDHVKIGANVLVGMGAVVVGNIEDGAILAGNPARQRPKTSP